MTAESVVHIKQFVVDEMQSSAVIDVYALADRLQTHCPEVTVNEIAEIITQTVVDLYGNAVWKRLAGPGRNPR